MTDLRLADKPATAGLLSEWASPSTAEAFEGLIGDEYKSLAPSLFALRRGPIRYSCNKTVFVEGDASEYICLVISGVVRSFRLFEDGSRRILAFYLPTELFGFTNHRTYLLSAEAAADANILFFKRSALLSMANQESRIANFLWTAVLNELRRTQEHSLLLTRGAECRLASFLIDLSKRMGTETSTSLDLPMSHQDIADHLGLTIETISRVITRMENSRLVMRGRTNRDLILHNRGALARMAN